MKILFFNSDFKILYGLHIDRITFDNFLHKFESYFLIGECQFFSISAKFLALNGNVRGRGEEEFLNFIIAKNDSWTLWICNFLK